MRRKTKINISYHTQYDMVTQWQRIIYKLCVNVVCLEIYHDRRLNVIKWNRNNTIKILYSALQSDANEGISLFN